MRGETEVPGGTLNLFSTNYPDHGHHGRLPLSRKNAHGRAWNRTRDLMVGLTTKPRCWSQFGKRLSAEHTVSDPTIHTSRNIDWQQQLQEYISSIVVHESGALWRKSLRCNYCFINSTYCARNCRHNRSLQ